MAALLRKAPFSGTTATRDRRVTVVAKAQKAEASSFSSKAAATMLAATMALTSLPALDPWVMPARADEEVAEENLSPYERRQREMQKRRDMLRAAREQAEAKQAEAAAVQEAKVAEAEAAVEAGNAERRAMTSDLGRSAASTYESTTSRYRGFGGFSAPTPAPAPPPAAVPEPAPAPPAPTVPVRSFWNAPKEEPKPAPVVVEVKKPAPAPAPAKKAEEPKAQGKQKRRGPLPLFLAEVLVLGSFAGVFMAFTKYADVTNKALATAGEQAKKLIVSAEEAISKAK